MQKIALTERSKQLIKNYLVGGAALGGSGALLTSLMNYMQTLKQDSDPAPTANDDDTLYVNLPNKKVAATGSDTPGARDFMAPGVALTGGVLATVGSYALIRKAYQKMKLRELQEKLDRSQQTFIGNAEAEAQQKLAGVLGGGAPQMAPAAVPAGKGMGLGELGMGAPLAFALLSAIAAGGLTNHALNKTFPRVKQPKTLTPKKVLIRRNPAKPEEEEAKNKKVAYEAVPANEQYEDALAFLGHVVMGYKEAAESELGDIVHAVAQGRHDEFVSNMLELGYDTAVTTIKGASEQPITSKARTLAISLCAKSAALSPVFAILAAAEYNEMAPRFTKLASLQNEDDQLLLVKIAGVLGALQRYDIFDDADVDNMVTVTTNKQAADAGTIAQILAMLNGAPAGAHPGAHGEVNPGHGAEDSPDGLDANETVNKEDSISSNEELETDDSNPMANGEGNPEVINELGADDDFIDEVLSQPTAPSKAIASLTH